MESKLKYPSVKWNWSLEEEGGCEVTEYCMVFYSTTLLRIAVSVTLTLAPVSHFAVDLLTIFHTSISVKRLHNFLPHFFINTIYTVALIKGKYFHITNFWHYSLEKKSLRTNKHCEWPLSILKIVFLLKIHFLGLPLHISKFRWKLNKKIQFFLLVISIYMASIQMKNLHFFSESVLKSCYFSSIQLQLIWKTNTGFNNVRFIQAKWSLIVFIINV